MIITLIKDHRSLRGLTLRAVAKEIGIAHDSLWRFEQGKEVSGKVWIKIVRWALVGK